MNLPAYLARIQPFFQTNLINVLLGQRRVGKSGTNGTTSGLYELCITGSNAHLLSGEMATPFAGRSINLVIHSRSYREFLASHRRGDSDATLDLYLRHGGWNPWPTPPGLSSVPQASPMT